MRKNPKSFLEEMEYMDGISIVDTSGTILFSVKFNPAFNPGVVEENFIIGKKIYDVFKNIDYSNSTLVKSMELGIPVYKKRQKITNYTGETIHTMNISLPIRSNSMIMGAIELSRDITKYKEQNQNHHEVKIDSNFFKDRNIIEKHFMPHQARYTLDDILSDHSSIKEIKYLIKKIANSTSPVFIHGETGTGKELFAHALHNESQFAKGPFVAQNCAAIPDNLLESLLFGTTKGSFTGAYDTPGLFELTEGGTLFLDEINSMPIHLQGKLLRVLQDGYIRRLGDKKERKFNVRLLSASNVCPKKCVEEGRLRQDIFYRLCVIDFKIPPLRERRQDIPLLLNFFIHKYNKQLNKNIKSVSKETCEVFDKYHWPGNVRELEHLIEYAMNILDESDTTIDLHHVQHRMNLDLQPQERKLDIDLVPLKDAVAELETSLISHAIGRTGGNVSEAARLLKIPRQTLQKKIVKYNISPDVP